MDVSTETEHCAPSNSPPEGCLKEENDPFAYLERGSFTSEKFKIEIRGLPKFYGFNVGNCYLFNKLLILKWYIWLKSCIGISKTAQCKIETEIVKN